MFYLNEYHLQRSKLQYPSVNIWPNYLSWTRCTCVNYQRVEGTRPSFGPQFVLRHSICKMFEIIVVCFTTFPKGFLLVCTRYVEFSSRTLVACRVNNPVVVIGAPKRWLVITFQPGSGANWGYFLSNLKRIYPPIFLLQHFGNRKLFMPSISNQKVYTSLKNILEFFGVYVRISSCNRVMFNSFLSFHIF